jgi:hypothetical protein
LLQASLEKVIFFVKEKWPAVGYWRLAFGKYKNASVIEGSPANYYRGALKQDQLVANEGSAKNHVI